MSDGLGVRVLDWMMGHIFPWFLIVVIVLLVLGLPALFYGLWLESKKPSFELKKDDWVCLEWEEHESTTYVATGSPPNQVMMPITTRSRECVNWRKK